METEQQLVTDWLKQRLPSLFENDDSGFYAKLFEQAAELEKDQRIELASDSYEAGILHQELSHTFDDPKGRYISYVKSKV